jgi:hydroxypyruvate isomerase
MTSDEPTRLADGEKDRDRPMRFAANLKWLFTEVPFLQRFEEAASSGFDAVEYASPYEWPPDVLKDELGRWNLKQVLINTPAGERGSAGANGYACVPGFEKIFRDGVERALVYADALGCGLIHIMAGRVPEGCAMSEAAETFRGNLAWAADLGRNLNITFVLECLNQTDVPGFFLRDIFHAHTLIADISSKNVKLLFDVYHARMSSTNMEEQLKTYLRDIAHIQIADVPGRHEPGTGSIQWDMIARTIEEGGYEGWVGCEYSPLSTTRTGLGWRNMFPGATS